MELARASLGLLVSLGITAGLLGCHGVMWFGYDASRTTAVTVIGGCGEQFLTIDGVELPSHDAVSLESLAISDSGRVAHAARDGETWWLYVDRDPVLQARAELRHVAWIDPRSLLVVDADDARAELARIEIDGDHAYRWFVGPRFDAIAKNAIIVRDGSVAYVGRRGGLAHVVVDESVGAGFDGVANLHLDSSKRPSYLARRGEEAFVIRHGALTGPYDNVAELVGDARGERLVALVRSDAGWRADDGATTSDAFDFIGDVRLSRSSTLAFRAGRDDRDVVVVGDRELGPYPEVEPGSLVFRSDDAVAFTVKSEDGVRLVDDGVSSEPWRAIPEIVTDGRGRLGFVGRRVDGTLVVVVDGVERGGWSAAGDLVLGAAGHDAFVARRLGKEVVIADGEEHIFDRIVGGTLRFASDGVTWGVLTVIEDRLTLSIAGGRSLPMDLEEVTAEILRRRDPKEADAIVGRWIARALEAAIASPRSGAR